jgi:DNA-binding PadR family transcriptional regulator
VLLALTDEDRHGYGIMRQVEQQTEGSVRLGPGTLYGSIKSLLEAGMIQEVREDRDPELGPERRRYYRLTAGGRKVAETESKRLAALLRVARARKIFRGAHV